MDALIASSRFAWTYIAWLKKLPVLLSPENVTYTEFLVPFLFDLIERMKFYGIKDNGKNFKCEEDENNVAWNLASFIRKSQQKIEMTLF